VKELDGKREGREREVEGISIPSHFPLEESGKEELSLSGLP